MKYYKKENNKFIGFYDSEINDLFKDGKLKEGYFELSEEKWRALLEGQSRGKEIRILKNGELGLYEKPTYEGTDLVKAVWNEDKETWEEGATSEEILIERKNILLQAKAIKQEIKDLEEIAKWGLDDDLDSFDTIEMLQEKFDVLIGKAKELTKIYKKLKNQETQAI